MASDGGHPERADDLAAEVQSLRRELEDHRAQAAAMSDVLAAIGSSTDNIQGVFETIVRQATHLCRARFCMLWRFDGKRIHYCASDGFDADFMRNYLKPYPAPPVDGSMAARVIQTRSTVHLTDAQKPGYSDHATARAFGYRQMIGVPIKTEDKVWGILVLGWPDGEHPREGHDALLDSFAQQAGIAIRNARLFDQTQTALSRQTATSEILRVISTSPTDVQPVFDVIVGTAVTLMGCDGAFVHLTDGTFYWPQASARKGGAVDTAPVLAKLRETSQLTTPDGLPMFPVDPALNLPSRAIRTKSMLHLPDWSQVDLPPHEQQRRAEFGFSASIFLPLMRGDDCVGLLTLAQKTPRRFSEAEIALAESFRDQAMIALENVRLFSETQEALEYQTATTEVLGVISRSPNEVQPVLEAILQVASRLCQPQAAYVARLDETDGLYRVVATHNVNDDFRDFLASNPVRPVHGSSTGRAALLGQTVYIEDTENDDSYEWKEAARRGGYLSTLAVPLVRNGVTVGVLAMADAQRSAFSPKQIALLETFADQAVIAINNARLFDEVQARTADLTEALEQQKASAEILSVISQSVEDTQPVFEKILDSCRTLFGGEELDVLLIDEEGMLQVAAYLGNFREDLLKTFPAPWEITPAGRGHSHHARRQFRRCPERSRHTARLAAHGPGGRVSLRRLRADDLGGQRHRRGGRGPIAAALQRQGTAHHAGLRRPGGDRDPERAAVQGDTDGAGAPDRQRRYPARYQPVTQRYDACVRGHRERGNAGRRVRFCDRDGGCE